MTADRLREAATVSTAYGIWADRPGRRGKTSVSQQVATLLRAVADASWCACPSGTAAHDAALALADTILGAES